MRKQTLVLTAGTEFVEFGRLGKMVADAMHPGHDDDELIAFAAGGARVNLEKELKRAAMHGILPLKDPLTLAPFPFVMPMAVVSVEDLRQFLKGRLRVVVEGEPAEQAPTLDVPEPQPEEDTEKRNARWLLVFDQENLNEPHGAKSRAARRIETAEGVGFDTVRKAITAAEKTRAERIKREGLPKQNAVISAFHLGSPARRKTN